MTRAAVAAVASVAPAATLLPVIADARGPVRRPPPIAHAALALSVETRSPQDVGPTTVTLRLRANSLLGATTSFQYGTTNAYGSTSGTKATSLIGVDEDIVIAVAGLQPNTSYHFRAVASAGASTVYGSDHSFTTAKAASGSGSSGSGSSGSGSTGSGTSGTGTSGTGTSGSGTATTGTAPAPAPTTTTTPDAGTPGSTTTTSGGTSTATAPSAPPSAAGDTPAAPGTPTVTAGVTPVLGQSVAVATVSGSVSVQSPTGAPVALAKASALPTGTILDTRRGTVELTTARDRRGTTQTGRFWGAIFEVRQTKTGKGLTQLVLRGGDFTTCPAAASTATLRAHAAAAKPQRSLWGSDKNGRFQTRGRGSVATVRGTRWVTEDWCQGTVTRVTKGAVSVHDARTGKDVLVHAGSSYLARVGP